MLWQVRSCFSPHVISQDAAVAALVVLCHRMVVLEPSHTLEHELHALPARHRWNEAGNTLAMHGKVA